MHIEAMPYANELFIHSDIIGKHIDESNWDKESSMRLEISIVYTAVIIRKLWEHYKTLYLEAGLDLEAQMKDLHCLDDQKEEACLTYLTYVHRIIHSLVIDTSEETKATGIQFKSNRNGTLQISYRDITDFLRHVANKTKAIHG